MVDEHLASLSVEVWLSNGPRAQAQPHRQFHLTDSMVWRTLDDAVVETVEIDTIQMPPRKEYLLRVVNQHSDISYCVTLMVDGNDVLLPRDDFELSFKPLYSKNDSMYGAAGHANFSGFQQSYSKANYRAKSKQNNFVTSDSGLSEWRFSFYENEVEMTHNRGGGRVHQERPQPVISEATEEGRAVEREWGCPPAEQKPESHLGAILFDLIVPYEISTKMTPLQTFGRKDGTTRPPRPWVQAAPVANEP